MLCGQWGYSTRVQRCRTHENGLPHHRVRMYLVGWHRDVRGVSSTDAFQFPRSIPMMPLENILKVRSVKDNASARPERPIARLAVDIATFRARISQRGAVDWVVNTHHSKR